ncbi:hypothetical protein [Streptosporangium canum]|uniref:hypothetical protein n=1 Tax=Streptosporangium canum TaxID=324952 RepID=UPI0037ADDCEF
MAIELLRTSNLVFSDTVGTVNSSLISVPPDATLVAMCFAESSSASFVLSTSRGPDLVWAECVTSDTASGKAAIYTTRMTQDVASQFRVVLNTGTDDAALKAFVFTGVDPNIPVRFSASRSSTQANFTPSFTSRVADAWFIGAGTEYSAAGTCSSSDNGEGFKAGSAMSGVAVLKATPTPVAGSTVTLNFNTTATSPSWAVVVAELAPAPPPIADLLQVEETDTASRMATQKVCAPGRPIDLDEVQPIRSVKVRPLGRVADASMAWPIMRALLHPVGPAVETDTAVRVGRDAKIRPPEESDTAAPIRPARSLRVGHAVDTSAARPGQPGKARILGRLTDTSTVRPISRFTSRDVLHVAGVDLAQPIVPGPALVAAVGQAVETNTASRLHYRTRPLAITGMYRAWKVTRLRRTWSAGSPST